MDASATGRLEWSTAVCSFALIAISLLLFIIFVNVVLSQKWGVVCGLRLFKFLYMGCSDVSEFEHIYGQISTTPSCVYDPLFTRTRMMVVNALIV